MLRTIATKIFGSRNDRILRRLNKIVLKINKLEPTFEALSDDELKAKTAEIYFRFFIFILIIFPKFHHKNIPWNI